MTLVEDYEDNDVSTSLELASLNGAQKVALLLVQLGRERTAKILRTLDDDDIERVMAEVAQLERMDDRTVHDVMTEFVTLVSDHLQARAISPSFVRKVLNDSLGQERAEEMLDRIGGPSASQHFKFVIGRDPTQMAAMLADEHPQAIALILSKLPPADAMDLLGRLPNTLQGDVAFRMATMSPPTLEIIRQVEESFRRRLAATPTPKKAPERNGDQLQALLEVLKRATPETEEAILSQLDSVDPALAQELRDRMFTFDDLQSIDNKGIQALLREVDTRTLALALKGAKTATADRIYENLSERASTNLAEEVELLGRQPRSEVEEARTTIVKSVRNLQESGVIGLSRGSDDYVE